MLVTYGKSFQCVRSEKLNLVSNILFSYAAFMNSNSVSSGSSLLSLKSYKVYGILGASTGSRPFDRSIVHTYIFYQ